MTRRLGYILGLLFVAACTAAYPLTWDKQLLVRHQSPRGITFVDVRSGSIAIGVRRDPFPGEPRWVWSATDMPQTQYRVLPDFSFTVSDRYVHVPLWTTALAASLFMAWRWRRSRRRNALGFEVRTVDRAVGE